LNILSSIAHGKPGSAQNISDFFLERFKEGEEEDESKKLLIG